MINPFSDLGKETQNPFLDTRIRIWIFPKKRTLSGGALFEKKVFLVQKMSARLRGSVDEWSERCYLSGGPG